MCKNIFTLPKLEKMLKKKVSSHSWYLDHNFLLKTQIMSRLMMVEMKIRRSTISYFTKEVKSEQFDDKK